MISIKRFIRKHSSIFPFLFVFILLYLANYKPTTTLIGWDNLQTELNPLLAVKRAFFSVWQEYQSFGLVAGMAHGADLIRSLFVVFLSYILPQTLVRYTFHILMAGIGVLGMYYFLHATTGKKYRVYSLIASFFYLFNFASIQLFFLPFEPFSIFFAFLPWCMNYFLQIITHSEKEFVENTSDSLGNLTQVHPDKMTIFTRLGNLRVGQTPMKSEARPHERGFPRSRENASSNWFTTHSLFFFTLFSLLLTSAFYVQTFFLVYISVLLIFLSGYALKAYTNNKVKSLIKRSVLLLTITILINLFWILPQFYFVKTNSSVIYESKINQLSTETVIYQNKEKGTISNFATMNSFYTTLEGKVHKPLFQEWLNHFQMNRFGIIPWVFFIFTVLGLFYPSKLRLPFLLLYIIVALIFLSNTPPVSLLHDLLRKSDFLNQALRSPFTKFGYVYAFIASYFFTFGLITLENGIGHITKKLKKPLQPNLLKTAVIGSSAILLFLYALPAFYGNFFSPALKVTIPTEYNQFIEYMKKQDKNARIALFPSPSFYGWYNHDWGYFGSGFLWYGIEQPIVSTTFDTWSKTSEGYYWQQKYATTKEDVKMLENILNKYNISYIIMDRSMRPIYGSGKSLQQDRIETMLAQNSLFTKDQEFGSIILYKRLGNLDSPIQITNNKLISIKPDTTIVDYDQVYQDFGTYQSLRDNKANYYFPFYSFFTQTKFHNKQWIISEKNNSFILQSLIQLNKGTYNLHYISEPETINFYQHDALQAYTTRLNPLTEKGKVNFTFAKTLLFQTDFSALTINQCGDANGIHNSYVKNGSLYIYSSNRSRLCFGIEIPYLSQQYGYLVKIKGSNSQGRGLFYYVNDNTKKQTYLENRIKNNTEYIIIPPQYKGGLGYSLVFENDSYIGLPSENFLSEVSVYALPYNQIKSVFLTSADYQSNINTPMLSNINSTKYGYYIYSINQNHVQPDSTVILWQSYDTGWKAYSINVECRMYNVKCLLPFIFGGEIKDHVRINNWANGWTRYKSAPGFADNESGSVNIVLIFWPQYLEFIGLFVLLLTAGGIGIYTIRKK